MTAQGHKHNTADSPATMLLTTSGLALGYGRIPVVRDLNIEVAAGEIVAILGANGAGKTTTILGVAGELSPLAGSLEVLGRTGPSPLHVRSREGLAYVPEERSITFGLSTLDNLRLGRGPVEKALEYAPELTPLLKRRAGLLSGGEQQILTLARALASEPRLLLADELSLGLAPKVVDRLLAAVKQAAARGVGVLLVEQHVRSALAVADRAYVLRRGEVVMEGTAADLISRSEEVQASYLVAQPERIDGEQALNGK